jgi:hypothetical protein
VCGRAPALLTVLDLTLSASPAIDGDRHADRWVLSGTHRGELFGIPATGKRFASTVRPSPVHGPRRPRREDIHFSDTTSLMAQLNG